MQFGVTLIEHAAREENRTERGRRNRRSLRHEERHRNIYSLRLICVLDASDSEITSADNGSATAVIMRNSN